MTQSRKRTLYLVLTAVLLSLILLSASLSNLQFHAGVPFPSADTHNISPKAGPADDQVYSFNLLQGILGLFLLLFMIYVPARLILFIKIRWLYRILQVLVILVVAAVFFSFMDFDTSCKGDACSGTGLIPPPAAPVVPVDGPSPDLIRVLAIGVGIAAGVLLFVTVARMRRTPEQNHILLHAETAVQEIRSGLDFRNVIIQCYSQMSAALQQESGIERSGNMTSREFGHLLISRGFPAEPVHELTRLFEKVRYGQEALVKGDETRALDSLAEIIRFAKGGSRA